MSAPAANWTDGARSAPAHVPNELVHWLDHHNDDAVRADPVGFMDELRERYRVFYSPAYEGFWVVTRYSDQREAYQRHDLFSNDPVGVPGGGYAGHRLLPLGLDPPEHTKYRALINPVFAPKRIRALRDTMRELANQLIDDVLAAAHGDGVIDFHASYAERFPTRIFVDMMGLPYERYLDFLQWNNNLLHAPPTGDGLKRRRQAGLEINDYLTQVIAERTQDPGRDIISVLIASEVDGETLTSQEVLRAVFLLFMAGLDTVMSAHTWFWKWLADHPTERQSLIDDPSLIPGAIEELLRINSFVNDSRTVRTDVEFAGVQMKKGDRVWLHTGSACRDPREFPDPLHVDFKRAPNRHIAFSAGPHRCVGSHLARLELQVMLEEWHKRIPNYRVPDATQLRMHCGGVAGIKELPLHLGST